MAVQNSVQRLHPLLLDNQRAASEFIDAARSFSPDAWTQPLAPGKWSVAQQVEHVGLAYAAAAADLRGVAQMRLLGTKLQRRFWRAIGLTLALRFGRLPPARAPREVRPGEAPANRVGALDEFPEIVRRFDTTMREVARGRPAHRMMHPYFGELSLEHATRLLTVHTRHHTRALRRLAASVARPPTPV